MARFLPRSRAAWAALVVAVAAFLVLDVLALLGSEFAAGLLVSLVGIACGAAVAALAARPLIRRSKPGGPGRFLWFFGGIASLFVIAVGGSALAGIPLFPTAEGGRVSFLLYGLAFGFGSAVCAFSSGGARSGPLFDEGGSSGAALRAVVAVLAFVLAFAVLCLLGYVFIEFVLAPLARSFAT
ncbi:Hypothetical Protein RradSPS_0452 [Rubrobacter radiotolerans]|uniref:Uncharacterized protein n=1 Tax=Rubrobacter radiotolerans TaxID=42256 RepID=A0A023X144_RUBRA|nr:hypothetical protein [Rubrobacter radiotolerans]AHY45735.1 Hypothetical Protein RradSPS_0452 [Rubrobacter radiotolerans]MDX5893151.1 hypothetical protein [Rubrobacter radiotolerans]SMC03164.1 hypothetical protein SAMN00767673_0454 [Rubrobacter radiotolerans DSM 5868]